MYNYFNDTTSAHLYRVKLVEPKHFQFDAAINVRKFVKSLCKYFDLKGFDIQFVENKSKLESSYIISDRRSIDQYIYNTHFHLTYSHSDKKGNFTKNMSFSALNIPCISELINPKSTIGLDNYKIKKKLSSSK